MTINDEMSTETINAEVEGEYLVTPSEAAKLLRVPVTWVYAHQKEIPGLLRLGRYVRFRRVAIEQMLLRK